MLWTGLWGTQRAAHPWLLALFDTLPQGSHARASSPRSFLSPFLVCPACPRRATAPRPTPNRLCAVAAVNQIDRRGFSSTPPVGTSHQCRARNGHITRAPQKGTAKTGREALLPQASRATDRKSTRLNSC